MELVYTQDLKSCAHRDCGFESRLSYLLTIYTETPARRTAVGDSDNKGVRPIIAAGGPDQRRERSTPWGCDVGSIPALRTIYAGFPLSHSSLVGNR